MATFTYTSSFSVGGTGINGVTVNAYRASRFSGVPALNAAAPGSADATTTTGTANGFNGAFAIALPTYEDYYISATYLGNTYWMGPVSQVFADGTAQGGTAAAGTTGETGDVLVAGGAATLQDTANVEGLGRIGTTQAVRRHGSSAWDSVANGLQQTALISPVSVGVNINTFAGSGTINVLPTNPYSFASPTGPWFTPSPAYLRIATTQAAGGKTYGYISYTGTGLDANGNITSFTGCTTQGSGAGAIAATDEVYSAPFAVVDVVSASDSILDGSGSTVTAPTSNVNTRPYTDWFTNILARENRQAGLPDPGRGFRKTFYPFIIGDQWVQLNATITAVSGSGATVTFTANNWFAAGGGQTLTLSGLAGGFAGLNGTVTTASATSTQFTVTNATTGATTTGNAAMGAQMTGTTLGPCAVGSAATSSACWNPGGNTNVIGDTDIFRRAIVFVQTQTNGATFQVSFNGGSTFTSSIASTPATGNNLVMVDSGDLGSLVQRTVQVKQTSAGSAGVAVGGVLYMTNDGTAGVVGFNFGASGSTANVWANNYTNWDTIWLDALNPRRVYVAIGINDLVLGRSLTQLQTDLTAIVNKIQAACPYSEVVLCAQWHPGLTSGPFSTGITNANWFSQFVSMVNTLAFQKNCTFLDMASWFGDAAIWSVTGVTTTAAGTSATVTAGGFPFVENGMTVEGALMPPYSNPVKVSSIVGNTVNFSGNTNAIKASTNALPATNTNGTTTLTFSLANAALITVGQAVTGAGISANGQVSAVNYGTGVVTLTGTITTLTISTYTFTGTTLTFTNDVLGISANDGIHFADQYSSTSGRDGHQAMTDMFWNNLSYYRGIATSSPAPGWTFDRAPWARISATVFAISDFRNLTTISSKGTKLAWTEAGVQKYGVVASSTFSAGNATTVTLVAETVYNGMAATPDVLSTWYAPGGTLPPGFPNQFAYNPATVGVNTTNYTANWNIHGGRCTVTYYNLSAADTGSTTAYTMTAPITSGGLSIGYCTAQDNGVSGTATIGIGAASTTIALQKGNMNLIISSGAWTNAGPRSALFTFSYPI